MSGKALIAAGIDTLTDPIGVINDLVVVAVVMAVVLLNWTKDELCKKCRN